MSYHRERRHLDPGDFGADRAHAGLTPGKTTRTEALQRKMAASPAPLSAAPHDVAQRGTSGAAGALPHLDLIQRAFGRHDLRGVQAHTDEAAADSARALGAEAYATGDRIAFAGAPDLHTAAHEAAHVIQQRAGLVSGGVGAADDHHERTADAVADRVVSGQSAEALLDELVGGAGGAGGATGATSGPSGAAVQRKPSRFQELSTDPLLSPSLLQQVTQSEWTAYITAVKPYFKVSDQDKHGQRVALQTAYSRAMSLSTAYRSKFTPSQRELAAKLNAELELERTELYGSHVGGLKDRGLETIEVHDEDFAPPQGTEHESRQDPGHCPLFVGPPTVDDVKQGNLGDCYLLAAIASLIEIDPMHFVKHMRDDLGGTVTVKLYKDVGTPVLVTVDKSVVVRSQSRTERFAKGALWVQLLEKAYVASGLKVSTKQSFVGLEQLGEVQPQDRKRNYEDISSGAPDAALMHLTGKRASSTSLGKERSTFRHAAPEELQKHLQVYKDKLDTLEVEEARIKKVREEKLSKSKEADVSEEDKQLQGLLEQIGVLLKEYQSLQLPILELSDALQKLYVSKDMFEKFVQEHSDNAPLVEIVKRLVKSDDFLPGALGSGIYGRDELAAFQRIKTAIDGKKAITASTRMSLSDQENIAEQEKGLAGESKVNGLASSHAYSVLAYRPKEPTPGQQIFIKLRNPWGSYGRKYEAVQQKVKGVADNQSDGTFWIDIADMLANFDRIDFVV